MKPKSIKRDSQNRQLFDVLIYHTGTRTVDTVAGTDMLLNTGHYNAERRLDTVEARLNDRYSAGIFDAGFYTKGDVIPESDPGM